jgi:hypothetical protein
VDERVQPLPLGPVRGLERVDVHGQETNAPAGNNLVSLASRWA